MTSGRQESLHHFLRQSGWGGAAIVPLPGDASTRRYSRLRLNGRSAMLMDQPQDAEAPQCPAGATAEERHALGYNAVARLAGADCGRFVATAEFLRSRGLSAPQIYAADVRQGFVVIEDLGDDLYSDVLRGGPNDEYPLYEAAIDALATLHNEAAPAEISSQRPLYGYDETALLAEIDLMTEWFMPVALGHSTIEEDRLEHRDLWRTALRRVLESPRVFVHRDYHAQNLFWLPARKGVARVGMIDFQDAVAGTRSYDAISLLEDARREVAPDLAEAMMRRYVQEASRRGHPIDGEAYREEAAIMAAQRNAKIAGIFARLYKRDHKPRYLSYLPRVWGYLERDLNHPALSPIRRWYDLRIPGEARCEIRPREMA